MNSRNSKTPYPYRLLLNLSKKINLKTSIHIEKVHMEKYKNNKFQISARILNEEFSVSDIQDYSEYIIKKLEAFTDNLPIKTYINKIENRITCKIKTGYYLQLLTP